MRKAYIQPEAEILSLASLDDFLAGSTETGGTAGDDLVGDDSGNDFDNPWA